MTRFLPGPDMTKRLWDELQALKSRVEAISTGAGRLRSTGGGGTDVGVLRTHTHGGSGQGGGSLVPADLGFQAATELTIATGAITVTQTHHTIDTEADAASDDLDTINGLTANQHYLLRPADSARSIVFKHGTGNIKCIGGADIALEDSQDFVIGFSPDGTSIYIMAGGEVGAGVFYDYVIDANWTGTEGRQYITNTGHTFKVYSTVKGAVDDANSVGNQRTSFFIAKGAYTESPMLITVATLARWEFFGAGKEQTIIKLAAGTSEILFEVPSSILDPFYGFYDIGFDLNTATNGEAIGVGLGTRLHVINCHFAAGSGDQGIFFGGEEGGSLISQCTFQGSAAKAIKINSSGALPDLIIRDCIFWSPVIGIDISNAGLVSVIGCYFTQCSTAGIQISASGTAVHRISSCEFDSCEIGINFATALVVGDTAVVISGNSFYVYGQTACIDFSQIASYTLHGILITSNNFHLGTATDIGVKGDTARVQDSIIIGNTFRVQSGGAVAIQNWGGSGNEAMHNVSVSEAGAKVAMADIGSPVGHVGAGVSGTISVQEEDVEKVATASALDFLRGFDVAESPAGEANIRLDFSEQISGSWQVKDGAGPPTYELWVNEETFTDDDLWFDEDTGEVVVSATTP